MNIELLNDKIRDIIRTILSLPNGTVRPANQKAPVGGEGEPYVSVLIVETDSTGNDDAIFENIDGNMVRETQVGQRLVQVSVQFFREGAMTNANRLVSRLNISSTVQLLQDAKIGFIRNSRPRDLTAWIDASPEERAQIDLFFHVIQKETDDLPTYGRFPINTTLEKLSTQGEVFEP